MAKDKLFSVSLVYIKNVDNTQEIDLRCCIVKAINKDEALGKSINSNTLTMTNYNLSNKVILEIKTEQDGS